MSIGLAAGERGSPVTAVSPAEFGRRYGIGPHKVLSLIAAGVIRAIDCRSPGSTRPRWRITQAAIEAFERSRASQPEPMPTRPRKLAKGYTRYFEGRTS
jgi:hypothetical protein